MSSNILQAKIESRTAAIKNLDQVLQREHASRRLLVEQTTEHEVAMAERVEAGTDNVRWTTWAEGRLAGMQMQLREADLRIEKILSLIVSHEATIKDLKAELEGASNRTVFVAVSRTPADEKPSRLSGKTVMDLDRKGPSKNPGRRYLPKAKKKTSEEKAAAKKAAEQAKKAKEAKADKKAKKQAARAA